MSFDSGELVSTWTFKDGKEYLLSLRVKDAPKSMDILLTDKISAEEWSGQFDFKHIETLTQRTGNYKTFDTFVSMIKYAILKKSESVLLDLMSYEDLKGIRNLLKSRQAQYSNLIPNTNNEADALLETPSRTNSNTEPGPGSKKYFIVTYVAEFDNVHYPLPLTNISPPNSIKMQKSIKKLMVEVSGLKAANAELQEAIKLMQTCENVKSDTEKELENLLKDENSEGKQIASNLIELIKGSGGGGKGTEHIYYRKLFELVEKLEQQIISEREEHSEAMLNLKTQNAFLRQKFENLERRSAKEMIKGKSNFDQGNFNNAAKSKDTSERSYRRESDRSDRSRSKKMVKSVGDVKDQRGVRLNSHSRTPSPGCRFDPTAYIKERKMKEKSIQNRINRERKEEIERLKVPTRHSSLESFSRTKLANDKAVSSGQSKATSKYKGSFDLLYTQRPDASSQVSRKLSLEEQSSLNSDASSSIRTNLRENQEEGIRIGRDRTPRSILLQNRASKNGKKVSKMRQSRSASLNPSFHLGDSDDKEERSKKFNAIERIKKNMIDKQDSPREDMVVTFGELEERIKSLDNLFERKFRS